MRSVAIFLADGFEEVEALTVVDLLRRSEISVCMVSITGKPAVTGSHGITVMADKLFEELDFSLIDMIVLPGGMPGTQNLEKHEELMEKVRAFYKGGKFVSAICAAPTVLGHLGLLKKHYACCYPSMEAELTGAKVRYSPVEVSGTVITSRGLGTAIDFALAIVERFKGAEAANKLAEKIVYQRN